MHGIKIQQMYTSLIYGSDNIHNAGANTNMNSC